MRQPTPERGYLWKFKNKNLWEFMAHWWSFLTKKQFVNSGFYLIHKHLWPFPARSAKPFMNIYGFIDDHFWPPKARSAKTKNIYASFMNIYDHSQREAQNHLWTFMASLMIIYDQKKSAKRKKPKTIYDLFWPKNREAQKRRIFMLHWWSFLTKTRYKRVGGVRVFV